MRRLLNLVILDKRSRKVGGQEDKPRVWQYDVSPSVLGIVGVSVENPNPATFVLISLF